MQKKPQQQTLTGLIRSRVANYQARQIAGVTQKTFAQELTDEGHPISYADFRTLYARARKQLKARAEQEIQLSKRDSEHPIDGTQNTKKEKSSENLLTKSRSFEYIGTSSYNEEDLI